MRSLCGYTAVINGIADLSSTGPVFVTLIDWKDCDSNPISQEELTENIWSFSTDMIEPILGVPDVPFDEELFYNILGVKRL